MKMAKSFMGRMYLWVVAALCAATMFDQAQGSVVFHDTFQAGHDTAPNIDYIPRQTDGAVNSGYNLTKDGGRLDNTHRILDNDSNGESSLSLKVYKPLGGVGSTSWTASRLQTDLSSSLAGKKYMITLDSQFVSRGGDPAGFDTDFAVGILAVTSAETSPMSTNSLFGIRLNGAGGGFGIYTHGVLVSEFATGSSLTWSERFELDLIVNEVASTVQVFLQGISNRSATDLGTYTVDFGSHLKRIIQLYGSQTDNGSEAGGVLSVDTYEMDVSTFPVFVMGYDVWSNSYALVEGPDGDDDSDGLANLYEYGFGGDPINEFDQGTLPTFGVVDHGGTNGLEYVHPQRVDPNKSLRYSLELSTDLLSGFWSQAGYAVTGTNVTGNALDFVTNRIDSTADQKFVRLNISMSKTLSVDHFGAVGDGVQDDTDAVVDAIAALKAIGSGGTLEFTAGKTYKVGLRADSTFQLDLQDMTNVTVNGNGAMLLNTPYRASIRMKHCDGVTVKNFLIDQEALGYTQGVITNVSPGGGYFDMEIMDGYDQLSTGTTSWAWGSVIDPDLRRIRWDMRDHFRLLSYTDLGAGSYRGFVEAGYINDLNDVRVGDIYFQPFRYNGIASNIHITNSKDCLLENVTLYSGRSSMSSRVDLNTGRITMRGFKVMVRPGTERFVSNWRDGVHCKDNRIGPIIEDCYFEALLDDSINMSQNTVMAAEIISATTFRMTKAEGPEIWTADSSSMQVGDRIMVFYPPTGEYIGPVRVASVDPDAREIITFETSIANVVEGTVSSGDTASTHFYNLDMCNAGYVIRNNVFKPQRRHAILARSVDGMIYGNRIEGVGGNGIVLENEYGASFFAGPFPQNVILSNNIITSTHLTPIKVDARSGANNTQLAREIDITGNLITALAAPAIELNNVQDVAVWNDNEFYNIDGSEMTDPLQITNSKDISYPDP